LPDCNTISIKDKAFLVSGGCTRDYDLACGNHEEADTRVWLHASATSADQVIIYSPDTDVIFIGLPIVLSLNKTVYVQLKDSPYVSENFPSPTIKEEYFRKTSKNVFLPKPLK
jgi:hypothetical protein